MNERDIYLCGSSGRRATEPSLLSPIQPSFSTGHYSHRIDIRAKLNANHARLVEGGDYSYLLLEVPQSRGPADRDRQPPPNLELKATRTTEAKMFPLSPSKKPFPTRQTPPFLLRSIGQLNRWLAHGKELSDSRLEHTHQEEAIL